MKSESTFSSPRHTSHLRLTDILIRTVLSFNLFLKQAHGARRLETFFPRIRPFVSQKTNLRSCFCKPSTEISLLFVTGKWLVQHQKMSRGWNKFITLVVASREPKAGQLAERFIR